MYQFSKTFISVVGILSLLLGLFMTLDAELLSRMLAAEHLDLARTIGVCILVGTASLGLLLMQANLSHATAAVWTFWAIALGYGLALVFQMNFITELTFGTYMALMKLSLWINGLVLTVAGHLSSPMKILTSDDEVV